MARRSGNAALMAAHAAASLESPNIGSSTAPFAM
jgi:hypothetical protein